MRVIWKYSIAVADGPQSIPIPAGSRIVHTAPQGALGVLSIWALVEDLKAAPSPRTFRVFGTGQTIPDGHVYVGTAVDHPFVWHVFEEVNLE